MTEHQKLTAPVTHILHTPAFEEAYLELTRYALTMELRGEDTHNAYRGVSEKCVPLWHEGVLCLDLETLRKLETAEREVREAVLTPTEGMRRSNGYAP